MLTMENVFCNQSDGFRKLTGDTFSLSNFTYDVVSNHIIFLNSTEGAFDVRMPNTPESGDIIMFIDIGKNLNNEPVRIIRLKKVMGVTRNTVSLNDRCGIYRFIYVGEEYGWVYDKSVLELC